MVPAQFRRVCVLLVCALCLLAGCHKHEKTARPVRLVFWEWWTDQQSYYETIAKDYEAKTGVEVVFELSSSAGADYFNKLQAAAQANVLPDIIGMNDARELVARYARAGRLCDLSPELRDQGGAWLQELHPAVMRRFYYEPGNAYGVAGDTYWGVPLTVMNIQIFYNREAFQKAGLDPDRPPRDWDEFLAACRRLKSAGRQPLLAGLGDQWVDYTLFNAYAWSYLGEEKIRALYLGSLPYTDAGCVAAFQRLAELKPFLYPGCVSLANKEAELNFSNGKAAMMVNGSWAVNVYAGMNPDLRLGVFIFPKPADAPYPMRVMGGIGKGCLIARSSPHRKEAIRFLKWFTSAEQQIRMAKQARELPANHRAMRNIDPLLKSFAAGIDRLVPDLKVEEKNEVKEVLSKGLQSVLLGESTPEKILQDADRVKRKTLSLNP